LRIEKALLSVLVLASGSQVVLAQEVTSVSHIYEAYYQIDRSDLDDWNRIHQTVSVPVLNALVEEGVIAGWSHWQHDAGDEYNVRLAMRSNNWAAFDTFWSEFLDRRSEIATAEARLIQAHKDEIWNVVDASNAPIDGELNFLYASTYQINFADLDEWNRIWAEAAAPILSQARQEGLLEGWVVLAHNTGGPHTSKVLYFFDSWDDIDDMFDLLTERLADEYPADSEAMTRLRGSLHRDLIYSPPPDDTD
jgi:hypothetical protein